MQGKDINIVVLSYNVPSKSFFFDICDVPGMECTENDAYRFIECAASIIDFVLSLPRK